MKSDRQLVCVTGRIPSKRSQARTLAGAWAKKRGLQLDVYLANGHKRGRLRKQNKKQCAVGAKRR